MKLAQNVKKEIADEEVRIGSIENLDSPARVFTSMKVNVPKNLIEEFDRIAELNHYSRVEAMKEAMRQFIVNQTPDNYASQKDWENMWRGMFDGILAVTKDPKYKELDIDPQKIANSQVNSQAAQMSPKSSESAFADGETL